MGLGLYSPGLNLGEQEQLGYYRSTYTLTKNIVKERGETKDEGDATHHIVAWGDERAKDSRIILANVGMAIEDANNGLFMHGMYHDRIHTDLYHREVFRALEGATGYDQVASRLANIRLQIQTGAFPF
ncbi:hypothetical protein HC024_00460 [Methylococcaceae bacterium WWC4]|nr:hypothetical protein [Methylococcaceae bacterium WWC4]